jgi:hypothetical protein
MLAVFCLRLAWGLTACLLLLPAAQVNPRFYRTHLLTTLGLVGLAGGFLVEDAGAWLWALLAGAAFLALLGALAWLLEGAPGGRPIILGMVPILGAALVLASQTVRPGQELAYLTADDLTSACVLGTATTAMLVGHSYLLAPTMSLAPLLRSLAALGVAIFLRLGLALASLWLWKREPSASFETETVLWLLVRWGVGLLAPLVLGWMAWETTRIRSTQSATGILYVVVIFCYLGELTSQLLFSKTGHIL